MANVDRTDRLETVIERIEGFVEQGEVDGAALAVARGGDIVAEWYCGQASPDQPSAPEALWPLASISKLYTAATVMALVERGELTLTMPVRSVLPDFDGDGRESVRLRHLLTHTSGLIYESPEMEERLRSLTPLDQLIDEAYEHPLRFPPGTAFEYSDFGFALAARMASVVTGKSFPDLVREYVIEPGELKDTFMPPPASEYGRVAQVTGALASGTDGAMYNSPYALELAHPAFGTVASVTDLLQFGLLFAPGGKKRILSDATIRTMTTDQTGGDARGRLVDIELTQPQPWGLGFEVRGKGTDLGLAEIGSPETFGHPGATGCTLVVDPVSNVSVAFVSNRHMNGDSEAWGSRLAKVVNGVLAALTGHHMKGEKRVGF